MTPSDEITFERASVEDAAEILELQKLAYASEAEILNDFTIPPLHQSINEILSEFDRQVFLKVGYENKIIGSIRCFLEDGTCHIGKLIVHPDYQNRGIGTRLLFAAEKQFPDADRYELFTSRLSEKNLHIYEKNGYKRFKTKIISDKLTLVFLEKKVITRESKVGISSSGRMDMKYLFLCLTSLFVMTGCKNGQHDAEPVPYRNWESSSVNSNQIRIHYWRTGGTGKPIMIMAHGITDYGLVFASLAGKLEDDYDIIMYDARGHGFSSKPEGPYDLATHVEDLKGLIEALGIKNPILMGHSMGSGIVSLFGATYPDIPWAIILEDPALAGEIDYLTEAVLPEWKQRIEVDRAMGKQKLIKEGKTKRHKGWSDFEYDHWAEAKLLVHANVVEVIIGKALANEDKIYPKISAPVLILKADADKQTRKKHIKAASGLANGKIVHIDGATHQVRLDKPDETEHQIRSFLAGLNQP